MAKRSDVGGRWHGEDPSLAALIPEAQRRAVEDLYLHAHVRAQMLCDKLWRAEDLREYLDVSESTWRRMELRCEWLRELRVDLGGGTYRWPAGAVVSHLLRAQRGKDER